MNLKKLSVFTSILFIISIFVYKHENTRGTDLLTGSDYIKGLDVNKIQKIELSFSNNKKIILNKDSDRFVLENFKSYPADTIKVNELIYKLASIQVKEKITSQAQDSDLEKYELAENKRKYHVEIFDNDGKKTVSFSVGKSYKGKGHYLYREAKKDVYLSSNTLWINSTYKDFINTILLDVKKDEVESLSLKLDKEIQVTSENKKFSDYTKELKNIRFDDFLAINDAKVQELNFNKAVEIQLKDKLVYKLSFAKQKDDYFVKLRALLNETQKKFVVTKDDGKEKLQNIENVIKAQTQAQKINMEKSGWVYKISKNVYEKLVKKPSFFN